MKLEDIVIKLIDVDEYWIDNLICELGLEYDDEENVLFTPFDLDINLAIKELEEIIDKRIIAYDKISADWYHYRADKVNIFDEIWDERDDEL